MSSIISKLKALPLRSKFIAGVALTGLGFYLKERINPRPTVSVITLQGTIVAGRSSGFGQKFINLESTRNMIDNAFKPKNLKLVCVNVNSPGGSAVQSDLVSRYIKMKAEKQKVDVIVFVEDTAGSGGYWLACTGKKIYAAGCSVVGSIGVISGGLGFPELIKKYGIERRVFTAGENKSVLDPLAPLKESDVQIIQNLLNSLHTEFINHVKGSRGDRLKADDKTLFNGEFWTAGKALELGLIDGIDTLDEYLNREYGPEVKILRVKRSGGLKELLGSFLDFEPSVYQQQLAASICGQPSLTDLSHMHTQSTMQDQIGLQVSQESLKMK